MTTPSAGQARIDIFDMFRRHQLLLCMISFLTGIVSSTSEWETSSRIAYDDLPISKGAQKVFKSTWGNALSPVQENDEATGQNMAPMLEQIAENAGIRFSESPSVTPTTPTSSPIPSSIPSVTPQHHGVDGFFLGHIVAALNKSIKVDSAIADKVLEVLSSRRCNRRHVEGPA